MAKTLREKFRLSLEKRGWVFVKETKKVIVLSHSAHPGRQIYLGRSGSVRMGTSYGTSLPVSDAAKDRLLAMLENA